MVKTMMKSMNRWTNWYIFVAMIANCATETLPATFAPEDTTSNVLSERQLDVSTTEIITPSSPTLTIFPNPTMGNTTIDLMIPQATMASIGLFSASGQRMGIVANNQFFDSGQHQLTFDTAFLPEGFYFLMVQMEKERLTQRLVVAR